MNIPTNTLHSPCVRNCHLNEEEICLGCFRSIDEITGWSQAGDDERLVIMDNASKRKKEARA